MCACVSVLDFHMWTLNVSQFFCMLFLGLWTQLAYSLPFFLLIRKMLDFYLLCVAFFRPLCLFLCFIFLYFWINVCLCIIFLSLFSFFKITSFLFVISIGLMSIIIKILSLKVNMKLIQSTIFFTIYFTPIPNKDITHRFVMFP